MKKAIGYLLFGWILFFSQITANVTYAQGFALEYCNPPQNTQLKTAIGCIETTTQGFTQSILTISLGIAGGIAFLMILLGAMQIQTSAGNPEKVNQGKEVVEGAISGLLLIIFAVFILRIIGVNILAIPGFQ